MKIFAAPLLASMYRTAEGARVLRSDSDTVSNVIVRQYLFDDLGANTEETQGRELEDGCCQPIGYRQYELKEVHEVEGRQGVATNGTHYFNSGSTDLYLYDSNFTLLKSNIKPFAVGFEKAVNHIGDVGYYDGQIYAGVEYFDAGRGQNISIALYDADTLAFTKEFPWNPDSGQVEVSALTVDPDNDLVWMSDWVSPSYIYSYSLEDGTYAGKLHLRPTPEWTQGITYYDGNLYITADDGNADRKEADNLWLVEGDTLRKNATYIRHELAFEVPEDFRDFGEIEGIDFNEQNGELIVLANRGRQITLGMPGDFYPGYDREIHEVFIFSVINATVEGEGGGSNLFQQANTSEIEGDEQADIAEREANLAAAQDELAKDKDAFEAEKEAWDEQKSASFTLFGCQSAFFGAMVALFV